MVDVLVVLDGASEPRRDGAPTSLERARTPVLDRLVSEGALTRLRTVAPWLCAGSEAAIPALLGWTPPQAVDRGAVEAAAHGIVVRAGERAWRIDVLEEGCVDVGSSGDPNPTHPRGLERPGAAGGRAGESAAAARGCCPGEAEVAAVGGRAGELEVAAVGGRAGELGVAAVGGRAGELGVAAVGGRAGELEVARAAATLAAAAPGHAVHRLAGHRLLLVGPAPLPDAALAPDLRVWPEGIAPPSILDAETVVVGARGAAIGIARLMGAATLVPDGATGLPGSDLRAKAAAAIAAIGAGAVRVVAHVGGPDEAAHLRDRGLKVAALEHADRDLLAPLVAAIRSAGGTLRVCPDHGCDPGTGEHDAAPVPCVRWSPAEADADPDAGADAGVAPVPCGAWSPADADASPTARRLTERAVAHLPIVELASAGTLVAA